MSKVEKRGSTKSHLLLLCKLCLSVIKKYKRLFGIVLFVCILAMLDWRQLQFLFFRLNVYSLIIVSACIVSAIIFKSLRWFLILRYHGVLCTLRYAVTSYLAGLYFGLITPGHVGELVRASYVSSSGKSSFQEGVAYVIIDRIVDLYFLFIIAIASLPILVGGITNMSFATALLLLLSALPFFLLIMIQFRKKAISWFLACFRQVLPHKIFQYIQAVIKVFDRSGGYLYLICFASTCASCFFLFLGYYILAIECQVFIGFYELVGIMAIVNILAFLPVTMFGLGTREVSLVVLLAPRGITEETSVFFGISIFLLTYGWGIICGFIGLLAIPEIHASS